MFSIVSILKHDLNNKLSRSQAKHADLVKLETFYSSCSSTRCCMTNGRASPTLLASISAPQQTAMATAAPNWSQKQLELCKVPRLEISPHNCPAMFTPWKSGSLALRPLFFARFSAASTIMPGQDATGTSLEKVNLFGQLWENTRFDPFCSFGPHSQPPLSFFSAKVCVCVLCTFASASHLAQPRASSCCFTVQVALTLHHILTFAPQQDRYGQVFSSVVPHHTPDVKSMFGRISVTGITATTHLQHPTANKNFLIKKTHPLTCETICSNQTGRFTFNTSKQTFVTKPR